jgi:hypothetical protein
MTSKLARIAMASLMLVLPCTIGGALAASTAGDQKALELLQKAPGSSFIAMEAKLIRSGKTDEEFCASIYVVIRSHDGQTYNVMTQQLYMFDKAKNQFGGAAVLPPGNYTITEVTCEKHHYRGTFARFTLQSSQWINLGRLIVEFKSSPFNPLAYPTYSGQARVAELTTNAVASLTRIAPVAFGKTVKRYMTPVLK